MERVLETVEGIIGQLEELDEKREELLKLCRELGRNARSVVMEIHGSGRVDEGVVREMKELAARIMGFREKYPQLYYGGTVYGALAEYVEALSLMRFVAEGTIPSPDELGGVDPVPYLLGLGDLVGELRRYMLNKIRQGDFGEAEKALDAMEQVYRALVRVSFPEALVPGLRRKVDVARIVIESSRKDYMYFRKSTELEEVLLLAVKTLKRSPDL